MAQFELPTTSTEVEEVCETWTGTDYAFSSTTLSESDSDPNVPEDVLRADFANGQLTPMSGSGTPIDAPTAVDPTLFDLVNASQDLRDASFDEPYYGVYGGGGGGAAVKSVLPQIRTATTKPTLSKTSIDRTHSADSHGTTSAGAESGLCWTRPMN